ncbi:MAG: hypothetical protein D6808_06910, partial [Candidatus Dadabacteria bacterium]
GLRGNPVSVETLTGERSGGEGILLSREYVLAHTVYHLFSLVESVRGGAVNTLVNLIRENIILDPDGGVIFEDVQGNSGYLKVTGVDEKGFWVEDRDGKRQLPFHTIRRLYPEGLKGL